MKQNTWHKFLRLPANEKRMLAEAIVTMYVIWFLLLFYSFKKLAHLPSQKLPDTSKTNKNIANTIGKAVARANRFSCWKNKCLVQSLAARRMLHRRHIPSQLSLGVALDNNKNMMAHAWLKTGEMEIVPQNADYKELYVM